MHALLAPRHHWWMRVVVCFLVIVAVCSGHGVLRGYQGDGGSGQTQGEPKTNTNVTPLDANQRKASESAKSEGQAGVQPEKLIEQVVRDLAHEDAQARREAAVTLVKAGKVAVSALVRGMTAEDPRVRRRSEEILMQIRASADSKTSQAILLQVDGLKLLCRREQQQLHGLWQTVSLEPRGKVEQKQHPNELFFMQQYVFADRPLVISGDEYVGDEFFLNPTADPKQITCWSRKGIYELTDETLRICVPKLVGGERPGEFPTDAQSDRYVLTLRRQQPRQLALKERAALAALKQLGGEVVVSMEPAWLAQTARQVLNDLDFVQMITDASIGRRRTLPKPSGFVLDKVRDYDLAIPYLQALSDLEYLSLNHPEVHDRHLRTLRRFSGSLRRLKLYHSSITDDGLAELAGFGELSDLDLGYSEVSDQGLPHLKGLTNLQTLSLIGTNVTDDGIQYLTNLSNLRSLDLSRTMVTDDGLRHLQALKSLEKLDLSETEVTATGVLALRRSLPQCRIAE